MAIGGLGGGGFLILILLALHPSSGLTGSARVFGQAASTLAILSQPDSLNLVNDLSGSNGLGTADLTDCRIR